MGDLVSVIVGGLLAAGSGAATQWYLDTQKREAERRAKREVKYEELIAAIYDYDHWLDRLRNKRVFAEKTDVSASPFAPIYAIATVYFPEFVEMVDELGRFGGEYEIWMLARGQDRLSGKVDNLSEGAMEAYNPYMKARINLLHELGEAARKEFGEEKKEGGV